MEKVFLLIFAKRFDFIISSYLSILNLVTFFKHQSQPTGQRPDVWRMPIVRKITGILDYETHEYAVIL